MRFKNFFLLATLSVNAVIAIHLSEEGVKASREKLKNPLFVAVENNNIRLVEALLKEDSTVYQENSDGLFPLDVALNLQFIEVALLLSSKNLPSAQYSEEQIKQRLLLLKIKD